MSSASKRVVAAHAIHAFLQVAIVCLDFMISLLPLPQSQAKLPALVIIPDSIEISVFEYTVIREYKRNE
jgi:hypothetical protein